MINIDRPSETPASLQDPRIRDYLNRLAAHNLDPENNPKPDKPVSYRNSDLLDAFGTAFHSKCYLTEQKEFTAYRLEIDHFLPQNERPDLIYEWSNLFPIDHFANQMRPRRTPIGGYMDPCNMNDDVEDEIRYTIDLDSNTVSFEANDPSNIRAVNSALLLDRLHNGHDDNTARITSSLRKAIGDTYDALCKEVYTWHSEEAQPIDRDNAKENIKGILSRKSSFTMLLRNSDVARTMVDPEWLD